LKTKLFDGSSVANPIDFLATGTAEQLGIILDYIDNKFNNIDGSVVIFGTTGMWDVTPVYDLLHRKMQTLRKPIFPVLPSVVQAGDAVKHFLELGRIAFTDEVALGNALTKIQATPPPFPEPEEQEMDRELIRRIIDRNGDGYLPPDEAGRLLDAACISRVGETFVSDKKQALEFARRTGFPLVMKVSGPVHKSDVGGVALNITSEAEVENYFEKMMAIEGATGVIIQQMLDGIEIFAGAKREGDFGHLILCGLGGIYVEVYKDVASAIAPVGFDEAEYMIKSLKGFNIIKGIRGNEGVNITLFADVIIRLSALLKEAPEISELDINPLMGSPKYVTAVDSRILIKKK
jgi:acetyltransferase